MATTLPSTNSSDSPARTCVNVLASLLYPRYDYFQLFCPLPHIGPVCFFFLPPICFTPQFFLQQNIYIIFFCGFEQIFPFRIFLGYLHWFERGDEQNPRVLRMKRFHSSLWRVRNCVSTEKGGMNRTNRWILQNDPNQFIFIIFLPISVIFEKKIKKWSRTLRIIFLDWVKSREQLLFFCK